MHFHAEHSLFFARRQPVWQAASSLALTVVVLVVNAGASSTAFSLAGTAVGVALLLVAYARGHARVEPMVAWTLSLVTVALVGGVALSGDATLLVGTGSRILCGVIWVLWVGTQMDWASFRQILLATRIPESVVAALDHALMHGILTKREWNRRRDAARLRLGSSRLPLSSWGPVLGEGALHAFVRLERVEENALLRCSASVMTDKMENVQLVAVDVERGGQLVLEELELRVNPREWLLVCGPSGAGKSSLLRLLAGLDGPSKGTMTRLGSAVSPSSTLRDRLDGRVALLAQNPEDHFIASTVGEDIAWGLLRRGVDPTEAQKRAKETAAALRIEHLVDRPCHTLSFGEQRRVALAGLLVLEPTLLLLDEPTAGLDPVAAHELRTLVQLSVEKTGATCVWSTHDLDALPPQAQRIILLRDRRVIYDGPTTEGLTQPWLIRAGLAVEK